MGMKKKMQLGFIRNSIALMSKEHIEGLKTIVECYPDTDKDKQIIIEMIKVKCNKKGWDYDKL